MKKIIAFLLCITMLCSVTMICVYGNELIVSTMKVSLIQQTVTLNDEEFPMTQPPYISDAGDTMIELEALVNTLGAEVTETDGVFVVVMDGVEMRYTLNSSQVQIGTQIITMNSPVVVSESGVAMAPLRFVAEALGADVTYNGETEEVIVVSSGGFDEGANLALLFKYSGKNKIGNSKEHWRFVKTDNFDMAEYDEGWYDFALGDIMLSFMVEKKSEGFSLEQYYLQMQQTDYYSRSVMYDKGKGVHKNVPYVYTKFRTLDTINERYVYETDEFFYLIDLERTFESFAAAKENIDVNAFLSSLEFDYNGGEEEDTVDLATIDFAEQYTQEKKTEYVDGNYRWTVQLNDTWEVNEYYGFYNEVSIYRPSEIEEESEFDGLYFDLGVYSEDPTITIKTYSVADGQTTAQWAEKKRALYEDICNPEVYTISAVQNVTIGKNQAKHFEVCCTVGERQSVEKLYYLSDGSYRYEIMLSYDKREEKNETFLNSANSVIFSFVPGTIDASEVGKALEPDSETEILTVSSEFKNKLFTLSYPCLWEVEETGNGLYVSRSGSYTDMLSLGLLSSMVPELSFLFGMIDDVSLQIETESLRYYDDEMNQQISSPEAYMKKNVAQILNTSGALLTVTMPTEIKEVTMLGITGYCVELVAEAEGTKIYYTTYYLPYQEDQMITVTKTCSGNCKNTIYEKALDQVISSLKLS
ncbi:MAG: copper amine oxidase N-terminal domain-containing protein [Ruminococcaceae bacterium]|nr:copper amine oxidase N-terminal domain-containing protein [Oscillospiraceae bacterium]